MFGVAKSLKIIIFLLMLVQGILVMQSKVFAAETNINATLCSAANSPNVVISSPQADSTLNSRIVRLQGTAVYTSQIEIYLNGNYNQTLAIGSDQIIDTTLDLEVGTNTIELRTYYSCNNSTNTTKIVLTYQPSAVLPEQADTTRTLRPGEVQPLFVTSDATSISPPVKIIERLKENLSFKNSFVAPLFSWISLLIAGFGLALILRPKTLRQFFGKITKNQNLLYLTGQYKLMRWIGILLALIFGILILI